MPSIVYAIQCLPTGQVYVGEAGSYADRRLHAHLYSLRVGNHRNRRLQEAFNLHGEDQFEFGVLEVCEYYDASIREGYWIEKLKAYDLAHGFNKQRPKYVERDPMPLSALSSRELIGLSRALGSFGALKLGREASFATVCGVSFPLVDEKRRRRTWGGVSHTVPQSNIDPVEEEAVGRFKARFENRKPLPVLTPEGFWD